RRNELNRMRAPAVGQIVEAFRNGSSGARDALQMMKLGYAREFFHDSVMRGLVRHTRMGERHRDVNVIRDKRLWFAGLARGVLGPRPHFRAPATCVVR